MKIKTDSILRSTEKVNFSGELPKGEVCVGFVLSEPAFFEGSVLSSGDSVFIESHLTGKAACECDRCLGHFSLELKKEFSEEMTLQEFTQEFPSEFCAEEFVAEQLLLSRPTKLLCSLDCKGLCPECGANLNTSECICKNDRSVERN